MKAAKKNIIKAQWLIIIVQCLIILILITWKSGIFVFAEQGGSSPESGSPSRLQTISSALSALGFGSAEPGAWGD